MDNLEYYAMQSGKKTLDFIDKGKIKPVEGGKEEQINYILQEIDEILNAVKKAKFSTGRLSRVCSNGALYKAYEKLKEANSILSITKELLR